MCRETYACGTRASSRNNSASGSSRFQLNWKPEYNWLSANLQVAAVLAERGYDLRLVVGDHDGYHGGRSSQYALRWLWRPYLSR